MFKKMWNTLRNYFIHENEIQVGWEVRRLEILDEYDSLIRRLYKADSLAILLELRTDIREFHQKLINNGLEVKGRPYVMQLTKFWNTKYKRWKEMSARRSRGDFNAET